MRTLRRLLQLLSNSLRPCLVLACLTLKVVGAVARNDIEVVEVAGTVVQVDALGPNTINETGSKIRPKAKVRVGADSRLVLILSNGARVLVEANSSFTVETFVDTASKGSLVDLRPEFGRYTFALPRQGPGDVFLVRGAEAEQRLATRGVYQLNITPGIPAQQFVCLSGEALFTPAAASSGPIRMKSGERLSLARSNETQTTLLEPMDATARRAIVEQLAYEREFKVYPLEQAPSAEVVSRSTGGGGSATLSAVLASIEDVVERKTQTNPSPTGG